MTSREKDFWGNLRGGEFHAFGPSVTCFITLSLRFLLRILHSEIGSRAHTDFFELSDNLLFFH
jgi:hypothetical protein